MRPNGTKFRDGFLNDKKADETTMEKDEGKALQNDDEEGGNDVYGRQRCVEANNEVNEDEDEVDEDDENEEDDEDDEKPLLELSSDEARLIRKYRQRKMLRLLEGLGGTTGTGRTLDEGGDGGGECGSAGRNPCRTAALLLPLLCVVAALLAGYWHVAGANLGAGKTWRFGRWEQNHSKDPQRILMNLRFKFESARKEYEKTLRNEYGPYYEAIFTRTTESSNAIAGGGALRRERRRRLGRRALAHPEDNEVASIGRLVFQSPSFQDELGPKRMKQRLVKKLLQVVQSFMEEEGADKPETKATTKFVWATGGHSSSAGHGNLHNESYTATLERAATQIFKAVNIDFVGRNYAMGGTNSYPEVALCGEEIFGRDADVLSWDYGMLDLKDEFGQLQYFYRTLHHPNRPAGVAILRARNDPQSKRVSNRVITMRELESRGMASVLFNHDAYLSTVDAIPDTAEIGATAADGRGVDAMPPMVRAFKCDGALEKGDPCGEAKYTKVDECPVRNKQASWHEGFKWHGLMGNLLALGMVELLSDALDELLEQASSPSTTQEAPFDPATEIAKLEAIQDAEYKRFSDSPLPDLAQQMIDRYPRPDDGGGYDLNQMYIQPAFCHIALLPSEYRYNGVLTDTPLKLGPDGYDRAGISLQHALEHPDDLYPPATGAGGAVPDFMRLAFDETERENCYLPTYVDYKDFFLVRQVDDWKKVVVPTDAAIRAYPHKDLTLLEGRVGFCTTPWPTGNKQYDIHPNSFDEKLLAIQVNGADVTGFDKVHHCYTLRHGKKGQEAVFAPNADGKFEIKVRVLPEGSLIKITSFIVW